MLNQMRTTSNQISKILIQIRVLSNQVRKVSFKIPKTRIQSHKKSNQIQNISDEFWKQVKLFLIIFKSNS